MKLLSLKAKYLMIPMVIALAALALLVQYRTNRSGATTSRSTGPVPESAAVKDSSAADVTVNGVKVPPTDGATTVTNQDNSATVTVSGDDQSSSTPSQTVTTTNPDGSLNVTVTGGNQQNHQSSSVHLRSTGSSSVRTNSKVQVNTRGETAQSSN